MSAARFTAGPWCVDVCKHGEVTVYEAVTLQPLDICKMGGNVNDGSNARLIAAAPDLLAALIKCVAQLEMIIGKVHDERCALIDGCAAIAKATGETL